MTSQASSSPAPAQPSTAVKQFAAAHYGATGARQYDVDEAGFTALLAEVVSRAASKVAPGELDESAFLAALHLEELVLARACSKGSEHAWEVFLNRYRSALYDIAYRIERQTTAARDLADSMYYDLYVSRSEGDQRRSKLDYYEGRGSLGGWLRMVVGQEFINRKRGMKGKICSDSAEEDVERLEDPRLQWRLIDTRLEDAISEELATLRPDAKFLLTGCFLEGRTMAQVGKLLGVHESTVSRQLKQVFTELRKQIRKSLREKGMSRAEADKATEDVEVQDLEVQVGEILRQEGSDPPVDVSDSPEQTSDSVQESSDSAFNRDKGSQG